MTIAYFCIVMSLFIPIACTGYAKFSTKGYNNKAPREFLKKLIGSGQRANYAQQNFYETFPAFAVGVVVAHLMQANQLTINLLAITYVISRIIYALSYIKNCDVIRSIFWAIAFGVIILLYFIGM